MIKKSEASSVRKGLVEAVLRKQAVKIKGGRDEGRVLLAGVRFSALVAPIVYYETTDGSGVTGAVRMDEVSIYPV